MNVPDEKAAILHDLKLKIVTVIERVGVTDMAVDIIIDLVARGLGRLGGRPPIPPPGSEPPPNGDGTPSKRVSTRLKRDSKPPLRDLSGDLFSGSSSPENPDSSKLSLSEVDNIMGEIAQPVALSPYVVAMRQFCRQWVSKYGADYDPLPADRNQLGRLVHDYGAEPDFLEMFTASVGRYLADNGSFVALEQRHSLRYFCTSGWNKYKVQAIVVSAREAHGIEAGRQFVNGEGNHAHKR